MRTLKLALALAAVAVVAFSGMAVANCGHCGGGEGHGKHHDACHPGDCPGYDKTAMTTFEAKVVSINKEKCKGCNMTHVDLVVKMKDGTATVRLGPAWYIDKQDDMLKKDDVIEIYASKVKKGDTDFLVAGKIKKGDDVLVLRDEDGLPMWRGWRRGKV